MRDNEIFLSTSPWISADFLDLEKLSDDDLAFIEEIGEKRVFPKGAELQSMGKRAEYMYYVQKGRTYTFLLSPEGVEKNVCYLNPGCFVGEELFFHGQPSLYTSIAMGEVEAIEIHRKHLSDIVARPNLAYILLKAISLKTRILATQIEDLAFRTTQERVARLLYCYLSESKVKGKAGITQQELATIAGAHRVSITNAISQLKKEGIITTRRDGTITVQDWERLRIKGFGESYT